MLAVKIQQYKEMVRKMLSWTERPEQALFKPSTETRTEKDGKKTLVLMQRKNIQRVETASYCTEFPKIYATQFFGYHFYMFIDLSFFSIFSIFKYLL